ncbi:MAG: hypothetical protein ACJAZP_003610 [Psychromonas sp.]|jgi:hypothetical protein|uniref:hypothetical protein n=1 Tax=Psychromonas sp. TaxID=1884585 RepID=UPI0039E4061F
MKNIYQNIYLPIFYILLLIIMSNQVLAEEEIVEFPVMNVAPVILEDLDQVRGLGGIDVTNNSNLVAVLSDNDATNNITGYNIISQGSFNEASGVFSIIQNTGNNVIIQDSTIITVTITPN